MPRHIEFLCEIAQKVIDGEISRVAISCPPGHAKSDTITRRLPLYFGQQCKKPDAVVLTGYSQRFADKNLSRQCRELARELGILSSTATALDEWEFESGVRLIARGVGNAPTGINPIRLLIADDPIATREQAESETERQNIWDWWTGSIVQRFRVNSAAYVIATRWHEDDLIGRLKALTPKGWLFINLPAIAEEGDILGREPGEALWPEKHPLEHLLQKKEEMGEREFEALYQGNPTPREGTLFQVSKIQVVPRGAIPSGARIIDAWDLAASEGAGDWTARARLYEHDGRFRFSIRRFRHEPAERNRLIRQDADLGKPSLIRVPQDPGAAGKESAQALVRLLAGHSVKSELESGKKEARADPLASQVNAGNVEIEEGPDTANCIEELRQFPSGKHDDMVDAMANAFNQVTRSVWSWDFD